jgi:hypothetical protein
VEAIKAWADSGAVSTQLGIVSERRKTRKSGNKRGSSGRQDDPAGCDDVGPTQLRDVYAAEVTDGLKPDFYEALRRVSDHWVVKHVDKSFHRAGQCLIFPSPLFDHL